MTSAFYSGIPVFRGFTSLMDPALYSPLPDDWSVGVADIMDSTKAIAAQRYKAVNMAGAAVIAAVTNATLRARDPLVWGEGTNACASDSKHFGAWDQNLTTQWHVRYGGRGVMIYWHVERGSVCIHSRLRRCSSSEVAAMIEGVLRHDTEMEVERQYVDSHGQSEVAFAFCRLLSFQLLPRLRAIAAQRLYVPDVRSATSYPHLACILARPIDWDLVEQQYGGGALHDRHGRAHGRPGSDPASLHPQQRPAPDLQGAR